MSGLGSAALPVLWAGLIVVAARAVGRGHLVAVRWAEHAPPPGRARRSARPVAHLLPFLARADVRRSVAVAAGGALLAGQVALAAALGLAAALPWLAALRARRRDRDRIDQRLPELADVLRLGAVSGLPLRDSVDLAAGVLSGPVAGVLRRGVRELARGRALAPVMRRIGDELGADGRALIAVVLAAESDGAASETALAEVAVDLRRARAARAEARARRLPVLMLFPLVLCVLPAFALLSVVPVVVAGVTEALRSA